MRIELGTIELTIDGGADRMNFDDIVLAACKHCPAIARATLHHGTLHNSTLTTFAQRYRTQLQHMDLTATIGFGDLGLKALAAYCTELRTLRIRGCSITAESLRPLMSCCAKLSELHISNPDGIESCIRLRESYGYGCICSIINSPLMPSV